jgi:hypothetical protein
LSTLDQTDQVLRRIDPSTIPCHDRIARLQTMLSGHSGGLDFGDQGALADR